MLESRGEFSGLAIDVWRNLEKSLGFECTISLYEPTDADKYGGFTGFVYYMADCVLPGGDTSECACDVGLAPVTQTPERFSKVYFSLPYSTGSLGMVQNVKNVSNVPASLWYFVHPFRIEVWVGVIAIFVLHMLVTGMDRNLQLPERSEAPPADLRGFNWIQHVLLKTRLWFRMKEAFFASMSGFLGGDIVRDAPIGGEFSTRQRFGKLYALYVGLFLII